jgi:hypothetical protein
MPFVGAVKGVIADRSLCPGVDPGIGMTGQAPVESRPQSDLVLPSLGL